jgi:uncharacterized protein YebE (UPF0316 family)
MTLMSTAMIHQIIYCETDKAISRSLLACVLVVSVLFVVMITCKIVLHTTQHYYQSLTLSSNKLQTAIIGVKLINHRRNKCLKYVHCESLCSCYTYSCQYLIGQMLIMVLVHSKHNHYDQPKHCCSLCIVLDYVVTKF